MLTRIDLRHFKCFETLKLPLCRLTLLSGANASGKSSVMQALVLLHQTMREHEWSSRLKLQMIRRGPKRSSGNQDSPTASPMTASRIIRAAPTGSRAAGRLSAGVCSTRAKASSTPVGVPVARTSAPPLVSNRTDPDSAAAMVASPAAAETIRSKTSGVAAPSSVSRNSRVSGRWTVSKRRTSSSW